MNGAEALRYARSRHTTSDFDRAARQQRLLLSLREQAEPAGAHPAPARPRQGAQGAVKTDIPVDQLDELLGLASQVDTTNISSYVFQPPLYGSETRPGAPIYKMFPNVQRIRQRGQERVQAQSGGRGAGRGARRGGRPDLGPQRVQRPRRAAAALAGYLEYRGLAASSPRQKPAGAIPADDEDRRLQRRRDRSSRTPSRSSRRRSRSRSRPRPTRPSGRTSSSRSARNTPKLEAPPLS